VSVTASKLHPLDFHAHRLEWGRVKTHPKALYQESLINFKDRAAMSQKESRKWQRNII